MASRPQEQLQTNTDRRMVPRDEISLGVTLRRVNEADIIPAAIANLSPTGFLAELPAGASLPAEVDVDLPNAGQARAQVVWRSGALAGCNFLNPLGRADISAARLKSAFDESDAEKAPAPLMFEIGPSDPIWEMLNEVHPSEKLPLRVRSALIAAVAVLPWLSLVGVAALFG